MARTSDQQTDGEKPTRKINPASLANLKGGSRAGSPNKLTKAVKDMILGALDRAGGEAYLLRQAEANPVAFMGLVGKVLPLTLANDGKTALHIHLTREDEAL